MTPSTKLLSLTGLGSLFLLAAAFKLQPWFNTSYEVERFIGRKFFA